jgi:type IV pilus biogenesis protein CpaD/CtpE
MLKTDLATAIEEWLEVREDKEQVLTYSGNGKSYTANDLIKEIREQSEDGIQIQEKIMKLSVDLLFRNCERV